MSCDGQLTDAGRYIVTDAGLVRRVSSNEVLQLQANIYVRHPTREQHQNYIVMSFAYTCGEFQSTAIIMFVVCSYLLIKDKSWASGERPRSIASRRSREQSDNQVRQSYKLGFTSILGVYPQRCWILRRQNGTNDRLSSDRGCSKSGKIGNKALKK